MKKNTFKPSDFKYDPIIQEKQPLWMATSVQQRRASKTIIGEVLLLIAIFAGIVLAWGVLA